MGRLLPLPRLPHLPLFPSRAAARFSTITGFFILAELAAVLAWKQVIVTELDDGSLNWTTIDSDEWYPQVDVRAIQTGLLKPTMMQEVVKIGGPSPMTGSDDKTLLAATEVRAAVNFWVWWLEEEFDGDIGLGSLPIWVTWMDDKGSPQGAVNATAVARRYFSTSLYITGIGNDNLKWTALQSSYFDGSFVISPGASDPAIYQELQDQGNLFGLMPPPINKVKAEVAALLDIAAKADEAFAASNEANVCGSEGCTLNLAVALLGDCTSTQQEGLQTSSGISFVGSEAISDSSTRDDIQTALELLQAKGTTILRTCGLNLETLAAVTTIMEELSFDVFALFSDTVSESSSSSYSQEMAYGWFQGAWIMDATVWHSKYPTRGAHSQMTSAEFAEKFELASGYKATTYAASTFACLVCITLAMQDYGGNVSQFRENMKSISVDEFFGNIAFDEYGQNMQPYLVTQYSNLTAGNATNNIIHPYDKASTKDVVFPRPSWAQLRCRYETAVLHSECNRNGLCDRSGTCVCADGWTGPSCATEEAAPSEEDQQLLFIVLLSSFGCGFLVVFFGVALRQLCKRRRKRLIAEKENFARAIEQEDTAEITMGKLTLVHLGMNPFSICDYEETLRRQQSEERGIRLSYLLSDEFLELARTRTGMDDPTFYDMKDKFFFGDDALGKDLICPRDGKPGVALVDWVAKEWRGKTTHFLSWTWGYKVSLVRDALEHWTDSHGINPDDVCLFMCFFVNNQYRIIVNQERIGAEELEHIFEGNLTRIGQVVALLDTWENPRYLTRIWTIFEQAMSIQLNVPVTMVLPKEAAASLMDEFNKGKDGIVRVKDSLTNVHSESAEAFSPEDEKAVKAVIKKGLGFKSVDESIFRFMTKWVGLEMEVHLRDLVGKRSEADKRAVPSRIVLT